MNSPPVTQTSLLNSVTSTVTGDWVDTESFEHDTRNYIAAVNGSGALTATVLLEVSNNKLDAITLATFSLAGLSSDALGCVSDNSWQYVRGRVTAISGSGATVRLTMGA